MNNKLTDTNKTQKLAEAAYRAFCRKECDDIYFGGVEFTEKVLKDIAEIFGFDTEKLNAEQSYDLISIYALTLIAAEMEVSRKEIYSLLKMQYPHIVKRAAEVHKLMRYAGMLIINGETPIIRTDLDPKKAEEIKELKDKEDKKPESEQERYYFESSDEMAAYGKIHKGAVIWKRGDAYINEFRKSYDLFENAEFKKAISVLKDCLALNPIGISARFEIAECYIQLKDYISAITALMLMRNYLTQSIDKALFYRRLGYIYSELENYLLAAACYVYSERFCKHPSVTPELEFIESMSDVNLNAVKQNPVLVLRNFNIPILHRARKA